MLVQWVVQMQNVPVITEMSVGHRCFKAFRLQVLLIIGLPWTVLQLDNA